LQVTIIQKDRFFSTTHTPDLGIARKNLITNKEKFNEFSRDTALDGAKLAKEITEWYEKESSNYFDFSAKFNDDLHH